MSDAFETGFLNFIKLTKMILPGDKILLAYSGGADSTCLMYLMHKFSAALKIELAAFYLNHRLRSESEIAFEIALIEKTCSRLGVKAVIGAADIRGIARGRGLSLEEAARVTRYELLSDAAREQGCNKIATAHHLDDSAETVVMKLIKGASPSALCGIKESAGNIIRPLLFACRKDIERYLGSLNLAYSIDSTNGDERYERNFVRAKIMPLIKELNPNFGARISSFMNIQKYENDFIDSAVHEFVKKCRVASGGRVEVPAAEFAGLHTAVKRRFLLHAARLCGAGSDTVNFGALRGALHHIDKNFQAECIEVIKGRFYISMAARFDASALYNASSKTIIFSSERPAARFGGEGLESTSIDAGKSVTVSGGGFEYVFTVSPLSKVIVPAARFDFVLPENTVFPLAIRRFAPGDKIKLYGMKGSSQKLSDLFINAKIYGPLRKFVPVISRADGEILAVCNIKLSEYVSPAAREKRPGLSGYLFSTLTKETL
ncbi:MAG: tRNA lysidine(34) synthetase TilS [Candidatus Wallbacteria bacterium GWC2_49_35]|uniref:tRNA(Ile)-lysidine synthase n=1 Tax=Candidatus Wallbacteria bacterium GWC2_49_35 TaxID=1817813 RepID=A0A1F7WL53_9BACT|nr:MAG: tRNA lysidine(34) synthetase TilS [Candidatus Wallbacteria bacterium GWC2_49_35]HBC76379.1 tRNA lysidine(34) synthetase TilS [Candidatus Wallbacteria bacterium]